MQRTGTAWRGLSTTVVLGAVLLVAGCGDEQVVPPSERSTGVATPTPTPSPTLDLTKLPEQPAAMAEPTPDGAVAAATYVLQLFSYTFATRDTQPWQSITSESCAYCTGVVEDVRDLQDQKHRVQGGAVVVTAASSTEIRDDQWFSVDMTVQQEPSQRVDADGTPVRDNPGGEFRVVFAISWDGSWRVQEMGIEQAEDVDG